MFENTGKSILLGVTGGIAAYKAADLCSKLTQKGYDVHVVMTANAQKLVTPLTFQTLSKNRVITGLWESPQWEPQHIDLADRCALLAIVPCTANMMAKVAYGIADDALSTSALSHAGPVLIAPAMNPRMWQSPAVRANLELLKQRGVEVVGPGAGRVACGADGIGRLEELSVILDRIVELMKPFQD
jgi:phosphopantothenoylcysteine decarboxylase/phosphopantothenate--cysteine ligase